MAVIVASDMSVKDLNSLTMNTLTASDTYIYRPGDIAYIRNPTGGALTILFDGDGGATISPPGSGVISVAAGYSTGSIASLAHRTIFMDTIAEFLRGTVTITGGTGAFLAISQR